MLGATLVCALIGTAHVPDTGDGAAVGAGGGRFITANSWESCTEETSRSLNAI